MCVAHSRLCLLCSLITYHILLNNMLLKPWRLSAYGSVELILVWKKKIRFSYVGKRFWSCRRCSLIDWQYSLTRNRTFDTESKFTSVLGDLKLQGSEIYNRTLWPWGPYLSPFKAHLVLAFSLQSHVYKHLNAVTWKNLNTLWHLLIQLPECE